MSVGAVNKQTGERIPTAGMPAIDDALDLTSVNPVQNAIVTAALANKQNATDNSLQTTDKTVVGAINEHEGDIDSLKSGLTNLDNEVNGDATTYPYADVITIEDAVPSNLADCSVKIEPVQDLHGYDKPWVGGAGKNKLPLVLADIKAANTTGTWSGNVYTISGMTFEIMTDNSDNVTGIKINGTTSSGTTFNIVNGASVPLNDSYKFFGCDSFLSGIGAATYSFDGASNVDVYKNAVTSTISGTFTHAHIYLWSGKTFNNVMLYPMFMLASETDDSFTPYTNLCPISGHTEVDVQRDGKNRISVNSYSGSGTWLPSTTIAITGNYLYRQANFTTTGGAYTFSIYGIKNGVETAIDTSANDGDISRYNDVSAYDYVRVVGYSNNASNVLSDVMLCFNDNNTDTIAYEPYQGKTYTIALGSTIYGGTVRIDRNGNTVMDVDNVKKVVDGTENVSGYGSADGRYGISISGISNANRDNSNISDRLVWHQVSDYTTLGDGEFMIDNIVIVRSSSFPTTGAEDMKTYLAGLYSDGTPLEFVFKLATPTTIQLTPQQIQLLKGTNTLTASTGDISVTVNGVSGAIGSLTEEVAGLSESVVDRFDDVIGWSKNKNLIPLTLKDIKKSTVGGTWNGNKYTINSVEYEVIIDSKGCVSKIRANGTPQTGSGSATFLIMNRPNINPGTAIISTGTDAKGSSTTYCVVTLDGAWGNQQNIYDSKTVTAGISKVQLKVYEGYTAENLDFRPMVRNVSSDPTYEPYHELIGKSVNDLLDRVPTAPTTDGTYRLQVTVSSGTPTYSWVSTT